MGLTDTVVLFAKEARFFLDLLKVFFQARSHQNEVGHRHFFTFLT